MVSLLNRGTGKVGRTTPPVKDSAICLEVRTIRLSVGRIGVVSQRRVGDAEMAGPIITDVKYGAAPGLRRVVFNDRAGDVQVEAGTVRVDGATAAAAQRPGPGRVGTAADGIVVGDQGTILRTTDGGESWVPQDSGVSETLLNVSFGDPSNGTAVGQLGTILRTTDGGQTWLREESGTNQDLYGVSFPETKTGNAVGAFGAILRTAAQGPTPRPTVTPRPRPTPAPRP